MRPFLLILITLYINIYFPSCCWAGQKLILLRKRRWFCWWYSPSCLAKFLWYHYELEFPAVAVWYSRSTIMTMKVPVFREEEVSIRQFLKFSSFTKTHIYLFSFWNLKVVSATFLPVCFVCLRESTCESRTNVFYFTSKALFVLEIIKF